MSKIPEPYQSRRKRVHFKLDAPEAEEVSLQIEINTRKKKSRSMKKDKNGMWRKIVVLSPGIYRYKFVAGGQNRNVPENNPMISNTYRSLHNELIVYLPHTREI